MIYDLITITNPYFFSVMETPKHLSVCSCSLKLGVEQLSTDDVNNSKELERKYKLVNQAIHFDGPCDSTEDCTIMDQIIKIKDRIAEYYFDSENRLIAIPNHITLPLKPTDLDPNETDEKRKNRYAIENDKYYEDILHLTLTTALSKLKSDGLILEGFQSNDCLKAKLELVKKLREENQCQCKKDCTCGKAKYPALNVHEKEALEILDCRDVTDEEIELCTQLLKVFKLTETKTATPKAKKQKVEHETEKKGWLFNKVKIYIDLINYLIHLQLKIMYYALYITVSYLF